MRLWDIARQNWRADLESSAKLSTYSEFKSLLNPEKYLKVVKNYFIRKQLAKLRTSNHDLMIEKGRYKALRLRIEHVNSVTCNGLKTNTIFFSSVQNMMIFDGNTCHGIMYIIQISVNILTLFQPKMTLSYKLCQFVNFCL